MSGRGKSKVFPRRELTRDLYRLLDHLREHPESHTAAALQRALARSESWTYKLIQQAVALGQAQRDGRGRYLAVVNPPSIPTELPEVWRGLHRESRIDQPHPDRLEPGDWVRFAATPQVDHAASVIKLYGRVQRFVAPRTVLTPGELKGMAPERLARMADTHTFRVPSYLVWVHGAGRDHLAFPGPHRLFWLEHERLALTRKWFEDGPRLPPRCGPTLLKGVRAGVTPR